MALVAEEEPLEKPALTPKMLPDDTLSHERAMNSTIISKVIMEKAVKLHLKGKKEEPGEKTSPTPTMTTNDQT